MPVQDIPFSSASFDRAGHLRKDKDYLKSARRAPETLVMLMKDGAPFVSGARSDRSFEPGEPLPAGERTLYWIGAQILDLVSEEDQLFLGLNSAGEPMFAVDVPDSLPLDAIKDGAFEDARSAASFMSPIEASMTATARSIFSWRDRHGFCANCGVRTRIAEAGWKRECPACNAEHFPRVDPVAIMLAVKGDKCLMGRQASWAPGFWSCLAGFIEPGETMEQGAARELFEEAGIKWNGKCEYLFC